MKQTIARAIMEFVVRKIISYCNKENLRAFRNAFVASLICMTGFMPQKSSSQPLANGQSKFLGCATSQNIYRSLDKYWNQVTPGDAGKWGSVEYVQGQYSWANLDIIYNYALQKNLPFKNHVLIWGQQQPAWITSLDTASQRAAIEKWIDTVGKRYPAMTFCDVVNEPISAPALYRNTLGGSGGTGWDWVIAAFQLARKHLAPGVKLILNEYNFLHSTTSTTNVLTIINLLKQRGLIDGVGVQGHYFEFRSHVGSTSNTYVWDIPTIKSNLNRLTATGLPVYVTEFDIDEPVDSIQLAQYKIYFPIFWSNPGVKGITFWGYIWNDIWSSHPNTYLINDRNQERPALQWLRTYILTPAIPAPISPVNGTGLPRNPILMWHASDSAQTYHIQVATLSNFPSMSIVVDTTVADTLLKLNPLTPNTTYYWRVSASNTYGTSEYSTGPVGFVTGDRIVSVKELRGIPTEFKVSQNYPNPFNPSTIMSYQLPDNGKLYNVSIRVYDMAGHEVATLVHGTQHAGYYNVMFDARNLPSGVYFCRILAGPYSTVRKLVLMK